jgi:hypothetical protein
MEISATSGVTSPWVKFGVPTEVVEDPNALLPEFWPALLGLAICARPFGALPMALISKTEARRCRAAIVTERGCLS